MKIKKIYFDMDGVLADFDRGVQELCNLPKVSANDSTKAQDDEMWAEIKKIDHFYDKLQVMPGALKMFHEIYSRYGEKCEILTGIPKEKRGILTAGEDKIAWMHRLFSDKITVNVVYKEEKKKFCTGSDCILVDDLETNIESWREYGGTGILHKSSQDTIAKLHELGIL